MPGLIGKQGIRPGALNMNRMFRALRYRTEQAKYVTYHRPPIYKTDDYGVPSGTIGSEELLLPNLPAIIRPAMTADYSQEKYGSNVIGAARVYTPNISTIKNYENFDQANNTDFNEIEGWDRLITNYRTVYNVWTDDTALASGNNQYAWAYIAGPATVSSDGESIKVSGASSGMTYTTTGNKNVLEADRLKFKIKGSDTSFVLTTVVVTNTDDETLTYTPSALIIDETEWLTVDLPFVSGTSASSIYQGGTRYGVTVSTSYDYEVNLKKIVFNYTGPDADDTVQLKAVEFYKSVSWHVHSLKDMTDGYIIFNCIRTKGRDDARRRAYE